MQLNKMFDLVLLLIAVHFIPMYGRVLQIIVYNIRKTAHNFIFGN